MKQNGMRLMSMGYGASLASGLASLPFLGTVLGGISLLSRAKDPTHALDGSGLVCFVAMFALGFLMRLIVWQRSSSTVRNVVRNILMIVLVLLVITTIYTIVETTEHSDVPGWLVAFAWIAGLLQIGSVAWILRYRHEL